MTSLRVASSATQCPYCAAPLAADTVSVCLVCEGLVLVHGRYRVREELGRGGSGVVFAAERVDDGAPVAVKIMALRGARDWKVHELFTRGSVALLDFDHPNIPHGLAFEEDARGRLYQVRERLDGGTLQQRIEAHRGLSPAQLRQLVRALLHALDYLHTRTPPVIHRDIKPANIMFRDAESWEPLLVDFESLSIGLSATGTTIVASAGYAAPEQLAGHAVPASDLYGLGAVLLFALTRLHPSALPQSRGRHDLSALASRCDDAQLLSLTERLLEPSLTERFTSAAEALAALDARSDALTARFQASSLARVANNALRQLWLKLLVGALAIAALSYWASGYELERRIAAFKADLVEHHPSFIYYGFSDDTYETLEHMALRHDLVLNDLAARARVLRGDRPIERKRELEQLGREEAWGMPVGPHIDHATQGETYVTIRGRFSMDAWLWSREEPFVYRFMTPHAFMGHRRHLR